MTKEQILEPHILLIRPGTFGLVAASDECSTDGALKAMEQYKDQECAAKDKRIKELEDGLQNLLDAVPKQTQDMDWWEDRLTEAIQWAAKLLYPY